MANPLNKNQKITLYQGVSYAKRQNDDKKRVNYYLTGNVDKGDIEQILTYHAQSDGFKKVCDGGSNYATIKYTSRSTAEWYRDWYNNQLTGEFKALYDQVKAEEERKKKEEQDRLNKALLDELNQLDEDDKDTGGNSNGGGGNTGGDSGLDIVPLFLIGGSILFAIYLLFFKD